MRRILTVVLLLSTTALAFAAVLYFSEDGTISLTGRDVSTVPPPSPASGTEVAVEAPRPVAAPADRPDTCEETSAASTMRASPNVLFALDACGVDARTASGEQFLVAHSPAVCPPGRCLMSSIQALAASGLPEKVDEGDTEGASEAHWAQRIRDDGGALCSTPVRRLIHRWLTDESLDAGVLAVWFDGMVDDEKNNIVAGDDDLTVIGGAWALVGHVPNAAAAADRPAMLYVFARTASDVGSGRRLASALHRLVGGRTAPVWAGAPLELFPGEPATEVSLDWKNEVPESAGPVIPPALEINGEKVDLAHPAGPRKVPADARLVLPGESAGARFPTWQSATRADRWRRRRVEASLSLAGHAPAAFGRTGLAFGMRLLLPTTGPARDWRLDETSGSRGGLSEPLRYLGTEFSRGESDRTALSLSYGSLLPCAPSPGRAGEEDAFIPACTDEVRAAHLSDAMRSFQDLETTRRGEARPFAVAVTRPAGTDDDLGGSHVLPGPMTGPLDADVVLRWVARAECLEPQVSFDPAIDIAAQVAQARASCDSEYNALLTNVFHPGGLGDEFRRASIGIGKSGQQSKVKAFRGLDHLVRTLGRRATPLYDRTCGQRSFGVRLMPARADGSARSAD
ncbi:MAG: hypothetical protein RL199_169 [Pseudomonadota bacterium]|jgi:hypothetical protein